MSAQSFIQNRTEQTLGTFGSGLSFPTMSTTQRLALGLGVQDYGMNVYDVDLQSNFVWTGVAWYSSGGGGTPGLFVGTGDPNGVVTAAAGSVYTDITDPLAPVVYHKGTGGNTGWV